MFTGRECYKYTEILSKLLDEQTIRAKASAKWLQLGLKAYVYLFGIPDVGFQLRARYVRRYIKGFKLTRALDAGCGIGLNSFYLARKRPSAIIEACDLDPGLVEAAKLILGDLNLSNVNILQADLTELAEVDKYDLIFCLDVIEHIPDDSRVLANFYRALKDGGILFLSTPHERHTRRYFKNLKFESHGHIRAGYTEPGLTELLERNNFKIRQIRNVWGIWGEGCMELYLLTVLRLPLPLAAFLFPPLSIISLLDMVTTNRQGYGLMVIAQKEG